MMDFSNDSIDELERLSRETDNVFQMTRGGYVLATRATDVSKHVASIPGDIEFDVHAGVTAIAKRFPALTSDVKNVLHIRRGGDISGQQLGEHFLKQARVTGVRRLLGHVRAILKSRRFELDVEASTGPVTVHADILINAAGPFINDVAGMLGLNLPVKNIYQQKIAFDDQRGAIPRDMPFTIDLDRKRLDWSAEEQAMLRADAELEWLDGELPAGTHCRPEGGAGGRWVKLGWAYNTARSEPQEDLANEPAIDSAFPEIVIRGAAKLLPALAAYIEEPPDRFSHYGGYYTMTDENWPLVGPLNSDGAFVVGALSGFGSMMACAAGKLCAAHVCGDLLPHYANDLSPARIENKTLLAALASDANKGLL